WLGFRDFSFARVINGVKAITAPEIKQIGDHIEARCREIGMREGLTEREIDILGLLAKGRDGKFIAEEYVLSYNTVKTHIKHIYQKLGVHSRQELIDLVGAV
ncbi:MAG: helix-turn-helix transcriptional regulator, partial [Raoultibacter sp.]